MCCYLSVAENENKFLKRKRGMSVSVEGGIHSCTCLVILILQRNSKSLLFAIRGIFV